MALKISGKNPDGTTYSIEIPSTDLASIGREIGKNTKVEKSGGDDTSSFFGSSREVYDRGGGYGYQGIEDFKGTVVPGVTAVREAMNALGLKVLAGTTGKLEDTINKSLSLAQKTTYNYFRSFDKRIRSFRVSVKDTFGGLTSDSDVATNKLSQNLIDGFDNVTSLAAKSVKDLEDNKLVLDVDTKDGTNQLNLINASLGGSTEVMASYQSLLENFADTLGPKFGTALKGQVFQVKRLEKGLGLSQANIGALLRRQIALTGEASTEMLDDIEKFSYATADATGGNAKLIAKQTAEIIANVKDFGNVTVEEATRIAAAVQSAGIEFSTFNSMLGQFQNFESATSAMSDLTAVFGIHMDSMELMMLANEDQEEFLYRIKEGFESQGLAMEDMNLAQKKVLADTMSMSVEQAELFFQEGALPDQAEMQTATATASAEEAIKRLNQDITNLLDKGATIQEVITMGTDEAFIKPLEKAAYFNANQILINSAKVSDTLKKTANDSAKEIMDGFKKIEDLFSGGNVTDAEIKDVFKDIGQSFKDGMTDAADQTVENIKSVFNQLSLGWWKTNVRGESPSPLFGIPFMDGILDAIPFIEAGIQDSFLAISDSMARLVADTGLPSLLDDLNESTMIATSMVGDRMGGINESMQIINQANLDNLPKMVEKLERLNQLIGTHVKNIEEGTATNLNIDLKLDNDTLFKSMYNYRHTSGGTIQVDTGEIKSG